MCKILFLMSDIVHANQFAGDPISVVPDDHEFSEIEDRSKWLANGNLAQDWPGLYGIVKITNLPVGICRRILEKHVRVAVGGDPEFLYVDFADKFVKLGWKRWRLDLDGALPPEKANEIRNNGNTQLQNKKALLNLYIVDRQGIDVFLTSNPVRV